MLPKLEVREVNLQDYIKIIQKRLGIIIAILIIIPSIVAIRVSTTTPIYRAAASIVIERVSPKAIQFGGTNPEEPFYKDLQYYQTQYKILGSRALAERVFDDLRLSNDPEFHNLKDPVAKLHGSIRIEPIRNSSMVLIYVEDTDPLRATSIANAFAKTFIKQDIEIRSQASKEAVGWLESQLGGIKKRLQQSEEALNQYIQENKIVAVPDIEKKTETLLENLKQEKSRLETELAESQERYKEKHPKMIALRAHLFDLYRKIEQETNNLLNLNQKMVQYNMLKKEVESSQEVYTSVLGRAKETGIEEQLQASNIRIVDPARPPEAPIKPQKQRDIFLSIVFSLFCGIGLSFFLEYLDTTIRTAEDVSSYINLPFLGYIPTADKEAKTETEKNLFCYQKPKSTITEAYRAIRTSILFASPEDRPLHTILVTSSLPQEGKTFVASNLSSIFGHLNKKVLLLDIDMRRPKIHRSFNVNQKPGLSDFLIGNIELESVIKTTPVPNLSLITSGTIPPNPSELLSSQKARLFFEELRIKFDYIIIDSPPILSVADTSLLANMVDGVVLVIKGASTRSEAVIRAKEKILEAKGKIIGAVINNIQPEKEDRYYYYHYYYSEEGQKPNKVKAHQSA